MFKKIGLISLLFLPTALIAQSPRSATGGEASLWAGGEYSSFSPDYCGTSASGTVTPSCNRLVGPTAFFDLNLHSKWGAEGEARWLHWNGLGGETESNYLIGPRYRAFWFYRLTGWVKLDVGGGWITTPYYPQAGSLKGSYFVFAPGGTLQYPLTHHIAVRGDYEYQFWPSFNGPPTYSNVGTPIAGKSDLHPNGFSIGVAYKFLGY